MNNNNEKDITETHGFIVMCGIMYFASMVYVYNRNLKIFGYFILVFIFIVSWIFVAKDGKTHYDAFVKTSLYTKFIDPSTNSYSIYILYLICALSLGSVIANSYGIVTVLKSYMDRINQVKSYDLNLGQLRRDDLFIFNTSFYVSTILLIGLIYSFQFMPSSSEYVSRLQILIFIIAIVSSALVAVYSTRFKSVKNDSLPTTNDKNLEASAKQIKGQTKFSDYSFKSSMKSGNKSSSNVGTDLLQSVSQLIPISFAEINQALDMTNENYQHFVIPAGQSLTVASGKTLTVASGKTLTVEGMITNDGIISNSGIINTLTEISGTFVNSGIINNSSLSDIPLTNLATLDQNGNIYTLNGNFTIPSGQKLTIPLGKTLIIPSGKILTNSGIITNYGIINTSTVISGIFTNYGIINDSSATSIPLINLTSSLSTNVYTLNGDFTVASGQTLTIPLGSSLTIPSGKTLTNSGIINDMSVTSIPLTNISTQNGNTYTLNANFTIPSRQILEIPSGKKLVIPPSTSLTISSGAILYNGGTIENSGTVSIASGGSYKNTGTYIVNGFEKTIAGTYTKLNSGTPLTLQNTP